MGSVESSAVDAANGGLIGRILVDRRRARLVVITARETVGGRRPLRLYGVDGAGLPVFDLPSRFAAADLPLGGSVMELERNGDVLVVGMSNTSDTARAAVRLTFNPSGRKDVTAIKLLAAALITQVEEWARANPGAEKHEAIRAIDKIKDASMHAVLAVTGTIDTPHPVTGFYRAPEPELQPEPAKPGDDGGGGRASPAPAPVEERAPAAA